MINYYKILNVPESADDMQIKQAFRKLAVKYHPDKTQNDSSENFIQVQSAYEILIDPKKRKIYDIDLLNYKNPQKFKEVDLSQPITPNYKKETLPYRLSNIFIKFSIAIVFIIITTYSCNFINKLFSNHNIEPNKIENKSENNYLKREDAKVETELKNENETKYQNGELKF